LLTEGPRLNSEARKFRAKDLKEALKDDSEILDLAQSALVKRWRQIKGHVAFRTEPPPQGRYENYVTDWKDNLLPTVSFEDIETDYRKGAGQELKEKFCAAYSSAALAASFISSRIISGLAIVGCPTCAL